MAELLEQAKLLLDRVDQVSSKYGQEISESQSEWMLYSTKLENHQEENKSDERSLDFVVNRFLMKLFKTANSNVTVIKTAVWFILIYFKLLSQLLADRKRNFVSKYYTCEHIICKLFNISSYIATS